MKTKEEEKEKKGSNNHKRTSFREVWKKALSPFASAAELAMCQRCSRRFAEKDGDDGNVAATVSSSERLQMGGGHSTKVESAKRRRQD